MRFGTEPDAVPMEAECRVGRCLPSLASLSWLKVLCRRVAEERRAFGRQSAGFRSHWADVEALRSAFVSPQGAVKDPSTTHSGAVTAAGALHMNIALKDKPLQAEVLTRASRRRPRA